MPKPKTDTGRLRDAQRKREATHVYQTMRKAYNEPDFRELVFVMGLDYEALPGETKREKMIAFVDNAYRHNRLAVLAEFLAGDRPEWEWWPDDS